MKAILAIVVLGVALSGCECESDGSRAARSDPPGSGSAGGDETEDSSHGPAVALREPGPEVPLPSRFELVETASARRSVRARAWGSLDDLRTGNPGRMSLGNWLCRIWTHYGPPQEVLRDGFVYAFRDTVTGDIITAYSAGSGPAMGGVVLDEQGLPIEGAQARVSGSVNAFIALIDATTPNECELEVATDYGNTRIGVRDGEWFEDSLEE